MPGKPPSKYVNEVYELILAAEHWGISSTDIAKNLGLKPHNVKVPLVNLKRKNLIYSQKSLLLKVNGDPDSRSVKYYAFIYKKDLPISSEQLATLNKIRVGRMISEVGK